MKQFTINGLKKPQFRGNSLPSVQTETIKAESAEKAGKLFEKKHEHYKATAIHELPKDAPEPNTDMESDTPEPTKAKDGK